MTLTKDAIEKVFEPVLSADWHTFFTNTAHDKGHFLPTNLLLGNEIH